MTCYYFASSCTKFHHTFVFILFDLDVCINSNYTNIGTLMADRCFVQRRYLNVIQEILKCQIMCKCFACLIKIPLANNTWLRRVHGISNNVVGYMSVRSKGPISCTNRCPDMTERLTAMAKHTQNITQASFVFKGQNTLWT